jgi:hypothetical protein
MHNHSTTLSKIGFLPILNHQVRSRGGGHPCRDIDHVVGYDIMCMYLLFVPHCGMQQIYQLEIVIKAWSNYKFNQITNPTKESRGHLVRLPPGCP